jgi:hypothetical protein
LPLLQCKTCKCFVPAPKSRHEAECSVSQDVPRRRRRQTLDDE